MKKKILLTAGGTATAWHFCQVINEYFKDDFEIFITDTNEEYLVPSSIYAKRFFKVPATNEENYMECMYDILKREKIDIIIPFIDFDLFNFYKENTELKKMNVITTAPPLMTSKTLVDKGNMYKFLSENEIPTPRVYNRDEIIDNELYLIKPVKGFGSSGVSIKLGSEIKENPKDGYIVQELCDKEAGEITAEIYNSNGILKIFQRRRVATKSGVCVKCVPENIEQINQIIERLVSLIECPKAFCIQFMKGKQGDWKVIDCNLRIGAGTALSTKMGFQLVKGFLNDLLGKDFHEEDFQVDKTIKSVLRVYEEIAVK